MIPAGPVARRAAALEWRTSGYAAKVSVPLSDLERLLGLEPPQ